MAARRFQGRSGSCPFFCSVCNKRRLNGLIKKGIIIRHLVLPNHLQNTKRVLEYIRKTFGKEIYISIMSQYFPTHKAKDYNDINRRITKKEYDEVVQCVENLGFINGYIQDFSEENEEKYVPDF